MNVLKKICYFLFICIVFSHALFSLTPSGINYETYELQDQTVVHILKIDSAYFDLILVKSKPIASVESLAYSHHAVAAINGGFFSRNSKTYGNPVGILKIEDQWYGQPIYPRGAIGWSENDPEVLFDCLLTTVHKEGVTIIPQLKKVNAKEWEQKKYIIGGSPILVRDYEVMSDFAAEKTIKSFLYKKHARSAIGVLPNGDFVFVVVDGTKNWIFANSGITVLNLALLMQQIGCKDALNLDGGGSSTMILQGKVMNTPCGEIYNGKGNYLREVSDAIIVRYKSAFTN